jgi:hypothetical protein
MNDELQSKLVEVLTGISEGVSQAKDFAIEQLPDVAQQYIMFGMVWETALMGILVVASMLCVWWLVWGIKKGFSETSTYIEGQAGFFVALVSGVVLAFTGSFAIAQIKPVLLVWFAPKLYLLQGIAGLVK